MANDYNKNAGKPRSDFKPQNRPQGGNNGNRPYGNSNGDWNKNNQQPDRAFPADYVDFAEKLMRANSRNITTSKLRNFLSLLMDVYNTETLRTEPNLSEESKTKLQMARIRIAYECGRDRNTKEFVEAACLLPWLKAIGDSREQAIRYVHYLEAIVAYHRYFGGREN